MKNNINAILKPSAPSIKELQLQDTYDGKIDSIIEAVERLKTINMVLYYVAKIQLEGACRISEVLRVKSTDIDKLGRIVIRGLKGSNDRIVNCEVAKYYLSYCKSAGCDPFSMYNRFYIRRLYIRMGIFVRHDGCSVASVTHALRYVSAEIAQNNRESLEATQGLLGHKNVENTKLYVNHKTRKSGKKRK